MNWLAAWVHGRPALSVARRSSVETTVVAFSDAAQTRLDNNITLSRGSSRTSRLNEAGRRETRLERLDRSYPVFRPLDRGQLVWQGLMVVAVVLALVLMPYQICVPYYGAQRERTHPLERMSSLLDGVLTLDIFVTFNVALLPTDTNTEDLVMDRATIARTYVRSWFLPDLLASFPFSGIFWLFDTDGNRTMQRALRMMRIVRVVKLMKFVKLLRLFRALRSKDKWEDQDGVDFGTIVTRLLHLTALVFLIAHYSACIFVALADGDADGWRGETWVGRYFNGGADLGADDDAAGGVGAPAPGRLWIVAMYWAMTTLTTVGYGDVSPYSSGEMGFTMGIQFIGSCVLGYVMGQVVEICTKEDTSARLIRKKIDSINSYMRHRNLPYSLKTVIRRHYSYAWKHSSVFNEQVILEELPMTIRCQVVMAINRPVLEKIAFLNGLSNHVKTAICLKVTPTQVVPGERVVVEGDVGNDCFIVSRGRLEAYVRAAGSLAESLDIEEMLSILVFLDGDIFAEYTLFKGNSAKHPYTVTGGRKPAELLCLSARNFRRLSAEFPALEKIFRRVAMDNFEEMIETLSSRKKIRAKARRRERPAPDVDPTWYEASGLDCLPCLTSRTAARGAAARVVVGPAEDLDGDGVDDDLLPPAELARLKKMADEFGTLSDTTKLKAQLWAKRGALKATMKDTMLSGNDDDDQRRVVDAMNRGNASRRDMGQIAFGRATPPAGANADDLGRRGSFSRVTRSPAASLDDAPGGGDALEGRLEATLKRHSSILERLAERFDLDRIDINPAPYGEADEVEEAGGDPDAGSAPG